MNEYKIFEGKPYAKLMNDLKDEGYRPMNMKDIAEKRLEALASGDEKEIDEFVNNYLDTSSGIVTYKDEIKMISDCEMLKNIDEKPELYNGGLKLTEESYNQLEGKTFNRKESKLNKLPTREEAKNLPLYQELLGETLDDYVDAVFDFVKKEYGRDKAMGVWIHDGKDVPVLRSCNVSRFLDDYDGGLDSGSSLVFNTRLVGVKDAEGVAEKSENFEGVLSKYKINSADELDKIISAYKNEEKTIYKRVKNFFSRK